MIPVLLACVPPAASDGDDEATEESASESSDEQAECTPGTLACECVAEACLGQLECVAGVCMDPQGDSTGDGDTATGDGDGDPDTTTGDGDGDPDTTTGDGDGDPDTTTGDGDGDPTTGDGDGDGDGLETCGATEGTAGCEFLVTAFANSNHRLELVNPHPIEAATVELEMRVEGEWIPAAPPVMVPPLDVAGVNVSSSFYGSAGYELAGALRVRSSLPVEAFYFSSAASPSYATHVLPVEVWGHDHRAIGWGTVAYQSSYSHVTVIAAEDDTVVQIVSPVAVAAGAGFGGAGANVPFEVQLDAGDVFSARTSLLGSSLGGMKVSSDPDHPIAVFSGTYGAMMQPPMGLGSTGIGIMLDQNLPVSLWGTEYVVVRVPPPPDEAVTPDPGRWQILSAVDNTSVSFDVQGGLMGLPPDGTLVDDGEPLDLEVVGGVMPGTNTGHFRVTASAPISVANFVSEGNDHEPSMVIFPPSDRLVDRHLVFNAPNGGGFGSKVWVTIGHVAGAEIMIDGEPTVTFSTSPIALGWEQGRWVLADEGGVVEVSSTEPFVGNYMRWASANAGTYVFTGAFRTSP